MRLSAVRESRWHPTIPIVVSCLGLLLLQTGCGPAPDAPSPDAGTGGRGAAPGSWPDNRPLPPPREPGVRLRTEVLEGPVELELGRPEQRLLVFDDCARRPRLLTAPLTCRLDDPGGWVVRAADGTAVTTPDACPMSIRTLEGAPETILLDGQVSPGAIDLVPVPASPGSGSSPGEPSPPRVDVVVELDMETYLAGVLDGELYGHWPLETFMAQAVAARSFALAESTYWRSRRHFDLVAGPSSQAWAGLTTSDRAREAIDSTRGFVLLHEGRVVPAYYSSSCGGLPASAVDSISDRVSHDIPPLRPRSSPSPCCEGAPVRAWEVRLPLDEVEAALSRAFGDGFPDGLARIEVAERNVAGRPIRHRVVDGAGGSRSLDSDDLRRLLGRVPRLESGEAGPLRSEALEARIDGDALVVQGRGFGHGVGLCQFGAFERGREGVDWRQLVLEYYPEATLVQSWE